MELLKELTQINSVSGNENAIREFIKTKAQNFCDEIYADSLGNLIAHKKGTGKKIMLSAHMDEIGVIVTHIDDKGFIRFSNIGGLNTKELVAKRVCFENGIIGVIGCEEGFEDKPKLSKLYIDVASSAKNIEVGDVAAFCGGFVHTGKTIISKAIDNRVGCYILLKTMEAANSDNDIYYVFSVQEEVGLRGAKTAAYAIDPKYAIAVDVTDTGDTPTAPAMEVKLGKGAAIKVMDHSVLCDAYVRTTMIECAKDEKIPYQLEIMTDGGTDAGAIHLSRGGVKTGGISVPTRYIHSPSEMVDSDDILACIKLLIETLRRI